MTNAISIGRASGRKVLYSDDIKARAEELVDAPRTPFCTIAEAKASDAGTVVSVRGTVQGVDQTDRVKPRSTRVLIFCLICRLIWKTPVLGDNRIFKYNNRFRFDHLYLCILPTRWWHITIVVL